MSGVTLCRGLCHTSTSSISSLACLFFLLLMSCCVSGAGHSVTPAVSKNNPNPLNTHTTNTTVVPPPPTSTSGCDKNSNSSSSCHGNNNNNNTMHTSRYHDIIAQIQNNKGMLLRTLYVLIGVTSVVVIYFLIKAVRLRRRRSKSKKYGIITTPASDLEMAPLDQGDDDDEDLTVFEMNGKPK